MRVDPTNKQLKSNSKVLKFDIYLSFKDGIDSNPNQYDHDFSFKNLTVSNDFVIHKAMI